MPPDATTDTVLQRLAAIIAARRTEASGKSYTKELLDGGPDGAVKPPGRPVNFHSTIPRKSVSRVGPAAKYRVRRITGNRTIRAGNKSDQATRKGRAEISGCGAATYPK